MRDRRAMFFLLAALVCLAARSRWPRTTSGGSPWGGGHLPVLALASYLDFRGRR